MRAAQVLGLTSAPRVAEVADGTGLRVVAVALNPLDLAVANGVFYGGHPPLPYIPGCEAVARTGDGRLVYLFGEARGVARDGFLAERVDVPEAAQLPLPDGVDP